MKSLYLQVSRHEAWGNQSARIWVPREINTEEDRTNTRRFIGREMSSLQMKLDTLISRENFPVRSAEVLKWARENAQAGKVVQNRANQAQLKTWFELHHLDILKLLNDYAGLSHQLEALDLWDKMGTQVRMEERVRRHVDEFVDFPKSRIRSKTGLDDVLTRLAKQIFADAHDTTANPFEKLDTLKVEDVKASLESDLTSQLDELKRTMDLTSMHASYPEGGTEIHIGYRGVQGGPAPSVEEFCHLLRKFLFRRGYPVDYAAPRG